MSLIERISLKPCPFCGGKPHNVPQTCSYSAVGQRHFYRILCPNCAAQTPPQVAPEAAVAFWNNRAALTAIMGESDGVQDVDREAAADFLCPSAGGWFAAHAKQHDDDNETMRHLAEAFARHRSTAAAAERARIVAWLRAGGPMPKYTMDLHDAGDIADAIERGEV